MSPNLLNEILSLYQKHGWQLRRVLIKPETRPLLDLSRISSDVLIANPDLNALWFSRASNNQREAWELRLLSEQPYALFETFEADEGEEERDERRQEIEAEMREKHGEREKGNGEKQST